MTDPFNRRSRASLLGVVVIFVVALATILIVLYAVTTKEHTQESWIVDLQDGNQAECFHVPVSRGVHEVKCVKLDSGGWSE